MSQPPECTDFAGVVRAWIDHTAKLKVLQQQAKEERAKLKDLEAAIIAYMSNAKLDVCRINHDGESGQLCLQENSSAKGVKRDTAVAEIASFFEEHSIDFSAGNVSTKADELWGRVQNTRPRERKKKLKLR